MERYRSGHNGAGSKSAVLGNRDRGFESHPLRHYFTLGVRRETPHKRSCVGDIGLISALYCPNSGRDARVGLRGTTGNRVYAQKVYRGFESLSLRHNPCFEQGEL